MSRCLYLELYFSSCICSDGFSTKTKVSVRNIRFTGYHKIKSVGLKLRTDIFHKNTQQLIRGDLKYFNYSYIQDSIYKKLCYFRGFLGPCQTSEINIWLKHFSISTGLFLYLLKTSENQRFYDIFRGYGKRPVTWNGLMTTLRSGHSKKRQ